MAYSKNPEKRDEQRRKERERYHADRERIRALKNANYKKNAPKIIACQKKYCSENRDKRRQQERARYAKNEVREKRLEQKRVRYRINRERILAVRATKKEQYRAYQRYWYLKNYLTKIKPYLKSRLDITRPQKSEAYNQRRAKKLGLAPLGRNRPFNRVFYQMAYRLSQCVGIPFAVDHIIPLYHKGLHHWRNLQVLTASQNRRKHKMIISVDDLNALIAADKKAAIQYTTEQRISLSST